MILSDMKVISQIEKNIIETFKMLHSHDVYHENIQVINVLIRKNENVMFIDFERSMLNMNKMILLEKKDKIRYIL